MDLARFPRRRYTEAPTPIEHLPRLSAALGGPDVYVKRDDLLGLASGGNKTRKLEFLVADALAQGADALITTGAVQSNHCRLTLAAAVKEGVACHLVLEERVPGSYSEDASGNNLLYRLLGADSMTVVPAGTDLAGAMEEVAERVRSAGGTPYVIPGGGSNARGALGYAACAAEILGQTFDSGLALDHVVCASGSGGTHAGLVAGFHAGSAQIPLTGISVRAERTAQEEKLHALAGGVLELAGLPGDLPREKVVVRDEYVGPGYSLPTDEMTEAIQLFARTEGILLDPVYTGKAAAGLVGMIRQGELAAGEKVLFVHTGGAPALYAYPDAALKVVS
ncbi:D-cysteine desulfhydrase [Georgenia alba]|uniref:D-cysteine desulfhydrase n=1 Tax=Georgenia alba TaxID=2233858 RepID=A0ABW2Q6H3_9MICO